MECRNCGASNLDGAERCSACGSSLVDDGGEHGSGHSGGAHSSTLLLGAVFAVTAVIVVAMLMSSGTGGGGGGSVPKSGTMSAPTAGSVVRAEVESATISDLEAYSSRDYEAVYVRLSVIDQDAVDKDEWLRRCSEVEAMFGTVEDFEIGSLDFLDESHRYIVATLSITFSEIDEPVVSNTYYVLEGGEWRQTMMSGVELTVTPEPVQ